ncbi:CBS domain-containing protein [Candidatus Sumerlaeota bacterium]|nr:CBS domain-containing protein [Candidatus Sumerlaeota bacterium]
MIKKKISFRDCKSCLLDQNESIKGAINLLNQSAMAIVLVVDHDGKLLGTVSDGDIRRSIISGKNADEPVTNISNFHPKTVLQDDPPLMAEQLCLKHRISRIPVLDQNQKPIGVYFLEDFVEEEVAPVSRKKNPVVIMAGGRGTRLEPFTRILPKPLIPIGSKTAVESIIDRFLDYGFENFILSVNYRKEFIKTYFEEIKPLSYSVLYVEEDKPLDTVGSLSLMKNLISETFILTNCDMIVDVDWDKVLQFHKSRGNKITLLGALKNFMIPYGIIQLENERYCGIHEKPEYNFLINLGLYVMEPEIIDLMEPGEPLKATDLVELTREKGLQVGVYPIYNQWFDIGQWEEYKNTLNQLEGL